MLWVLMASLPATGIAQDIWSGPAVPLVAPTTPSEDAVIDQLRGVESVAELEKRLLLPLLTEERSLSLDLGPEHPLMIDLRARIESARHVIARQAHEAARSRAVVVTTVDDRPAPPQLPTEPPAPSLPPAVHDFEPPPETIFAPAQAPLLTLPPIEDGPIAEAVAEFVAEVPPTELLEKLPVPPTVVPATATCECALTEKAAAVPTSPPRRSAIDLSRFLCAIRPVENATPMQLAAIMLAGNVLILVVALVLRRSWFHHVRQRDAKTRSVISESASASGVAASLAQEQQIPIPQHQQTSSELREHIGKMLLDPTFLADRWYHIPAAGAVRRR